MTGRCRKSSEIGDCSDDYVPCISHADFNKSSVCDMRTPKDSANPWLGIGGVDIINGV